MFEQLGVFDFIFFKNIYMVKGEFNEIVKEIHENDKEFEMTSREFLAYFNYEKRTKGNQGRIDSFLEEKQLETIPNYTNVWIDSKIKLIHKPKAKSKTELDPIQRIKILPAANKSPLTISRDAKLKEAITLMMMNKYSQLPVLSNSKTIYGFITWESIGYGISNGVCSEDVKDYINNEINSLDYDTPLLDAIKIIIEKEYVIVQKKDKTISGIVTISDISLQFLSLTEPFLLLEQIENLIRLILNGKFLIQYLRDFCKIGDEERNIEYIDDLNFGDYIRIIEKPEHWEKLKLKIDRSYFIKQLDVIRGIRNDIMHFDPEGITDDQRHILLNMANFLMELKKYLN